MGPIQPSVVMELECETLKPETLKPNLRAAARQSLRGRDDAPAGTNPADAPSPTNPPALASCRDERRYSKSIPGRQSLGFDRLVLRPTHRVLEQGFVFALDQAAFAGQRGIGFRRAYRRHDHALILQPSFAGNRIDDVLTAGILERIREAAAAAAETEMAALETAARRQPAINILRLSRRALREVDVAGLFVDALGCAQRSELVASLQSAGEHHALVAQAQRV